MCDEFVCMLQRIAFSLFEFFHVILEHLWRFPRGSRDREMLQFEHLDHILPEIFKKKKNSVVFVLITQLTLLNVYFDIKVFSKEILRLFFKNAKSISITLKYHQITTTNSVPNSGYL